MKYLIYLRVSTKEQDERTQLDHCLRYIKALCFENFEYEVFTDILTSKKSVFDRPGSKEMLAKMKKGETIIAMRVDRLSRKQSDMTKLIDLLNMKEVNILLVDQPGISNKIMLGIYSGMAEEEVIMLRKRVHEKFEAKRQRNERISGQLPYGYGMHKTKLVPVKVGEKTVLKPGVLVPISEEQAVLSEMKEFFAAGMSYQNIAHALNDRGYKNRKGRPFQKMSIYRILSRIRQTMSLDQPLEASEALQSC